MKRYAYVRGADNEKHLTAYIEPRYEIIDRIDDNFIIAGEDQAGWTLDEYYIPRIGSSGVMGAEEITEDNPIFERNQAIIWFEDSIVRITVVDSETVTITTFDGYEPKVNRIGMEFRLHLKFNSKLESWQMENVFAYRTDRPETAFRQPATDNQKSKLYKFFRDTVLNGDLIPARVFLAGQSNGIELAIGFEERELERLQIKVAAAESQIRLLQMELETSLVK